MPSQEGIRNIEGSEGFDSKSLDEQEAIIGRAKAFYLAKCVSLCIRFVPSAALI